MANRKQFENGKVTQQVYRNVNPLQCCFTFAMTSLIVNINMRVGRNVAKICAPVGFLIFPLFLFNFCLFLAILFLLLQITHPFAADASH